MILSDRTIRKLLANGHLVIDPIEDQQIQPASVDVRLGTEIRMQNASLRSVDPYDLPPDHTRLHQLAGPMPMPVGKFILGTTVERIYLPDDVVARVEGKSSLGRLGLMVHATAGFIDPGFQGEVTLELSCIGSVPVVLTPGMKIAQLSFMRLDGPVERPYGHPGLGSKYQDQRGPQASQYQRNRRPE